ncbi:galactokinase [Thalassiella azotivora]
MSPDVAPAPSAAEVAAGAVAAFRMSFDGEPDGVWSAPGRVNLVGEHVDYVGGLCLPLALPHRTAVAVRRRDDDAVRLVSRQDDAGWRGRVGSVGPGTVDGWAAYAAGVLWALREDGLDVPGVDVAVDGRVPLGAGLSSSAALECAVALAVASLAGLDDDEPGRRRLARACVRAENEVAGAPTGGMDQSVALLARAGHALLLDCRDGATAHVPLPLDDHGLALLVVDTRAPHRLVDGQYADRRAACERAAAALGVPSLREVADHPGAAADVEALLEPLQDDVLRRRARHVVTEVARVRQVVDRLRDGDLRGVGPLLDTSHESLRADYEVSSPELDTAVAAARDAGALGARMTGGGFGGSAIALVDAGSVPLVALGVREAFARAGHGPPGLLLAQASRAAGRES